MSKDQNKRIQFPARVRVYSPQGSCDDSENSVGMGYDTVVVEGPNDYPYDKFAKVVEEARWPRGIELFNASSQEMMTTHFASDLHEHDLFLFPSDIKELKGAFGFSSKASDDQVREAIVAFLKKLHDKQFSIVHSSLLNPTNSLEEDDPEDDEPYELKNGDNTYNQFGKKPAIPKSAVKLLQAIHHDQNNDHLTYSILPRPERLEYIATKSDKPLKDLHGLVTWEAASLVLCLKNMGIQFGFRKEAFYIKTKSFSFIARYLVFNSLNKSTNLPKFVYDAEAKLQAAYLPRYADLPFEDRLIGYRNLASKAFHVPDMNATGFFTIPVALIQYIGELLLYHSQANRSRTIGSLTLIRLLETHARRNADALHALDSDDDVEEDI